MDKIDHIYYINLDYRIDRRLQMETWLDATNVPSSKVTRISAIGRPYQGYLGATQSHIHTIETFLQSPHQTCIIFEDDYEPITRETFWSSISEVFENQVPFDLVMLSYNALDSEPTEWSFLQRVKHSYTASGYILTREFASRLLENFKESLMLAEQWEEQYKTKPNQYCLDVWWQKLMPVSRWYCIYPRLGIQRPSYSDIERVFVEHKA